MAKINLIFLDMDEVLVDFVGGACRLFGIDYRKIENRSEWDIVPYLSRELQKLGGEGLTDNGFWDRIDEAGEDFWLGLEELPWFGDVLELCGQSVDRVIIVTTPSVHVSSYAGKVKWLQRRFGRDFREFRLFWNKELLAKSDRLLIDDNPDNCLEFKRAGGESVVFPTYYNLSSCYRGDMEYFSSVLHTTICKKEEENGVQVSECQ